MRFLQKIGKSLMIPIACMPICGILMGIGYLLCPAGMQGGEVIGVAAKIGFFLITAGGAVIDHMPLLFAIGVGIGMSDGEGTGGLAALVSWLMMISLLSEKTLAMIMPALAKNATVSLALAKIENPFIGILAGVIGALCINRFKNVRLPSWLNFFSGKRLGIIMAGLISIGASAVLFVLWPLLFSGLVWFGEKIAGMGNLGSAIYATLNRLLIPFGLHHALNNVFWFDTIGIGDLTAFWAGKTGADVSWSVGMYMSGFFPSMMFGIPAAALAMRRSMKRTDKKTASMLFSSAAAAFVCGVTEPFEFSFMFASPLLYFVYAILYGVFTYITNLLGFRAGFSFSAGIIDLIFSSSLPAAQKTLLILPLGAAAFGVYYLVFRLLIKKLDLKTPGREDKSESTEPSAPADTDRVAGIIRGLGGKDNILSVGNCATRLRIEVKDTGLCRDDVIKNAGAAGVMRVGKNGLQVVIGMDVEFVADEINRRLKTDLPTDEAPGTVSGKTGNPGIAVGHVFLLPEYPLPQKKTITDISGELARLEQALQTVREELTRKAAAADDSSGGILEAQVTMLEDETFIGDIRRKIQAGINGDYAALEAGNEQAATLEQMPDAYMKTRAADIRHVAQKLYLTLMGVAADAAPHTPGILVAEELTPEQLIGLDKNLVLGLVTRRGSANSHTAILAGNYGIPYIFGADFDRSEVQKADLAALDADEGLLFLSPDEDTQNRLTAKQQQEQAQLAGADGYSGPVAVCANIGRPEDLDDALAAGAEGIGLFRTEFLFMNRSVLPDEEEQFTAYKTVLEGMANKPVIIRTMDIGADKQTDCLPLPREENPALGRRAIRLCLEEPDLFRTQLRAVLRAAVYGDARIMYPMIASPEELDAIREQVELAARELDERQEPYRIPPQGIMIETPAAAIISDRLAEKADFFSIGTNDLCQYTVALDRQAQGLERFYHPDHEAVLRLIAMTTQNAHAKGIRVGICGEMGGDPLMIPKLYEIGVDALSMSPKKIKKAKSVLASLAKAVPQSDSPVTPAVKEEFGAPADGIPVPMAQIPDEAFASGTLGRCVGIIPDNGNVYAPCDGTVTMVAETRHAIGIRSAGGHEVLIHVGINTVALNGKGFDCQVKVGDRVIKNQLLLTADPEEIRKAGCDPMVILAVTDC